MLHMQSYLNLDLLYIILKYIKRNNYHSSAYRRMMSHLEIFCDVCEKQIKCICLDSSDGEYENICICLDCVKVCFILENLKNK